MLAEYFSLTISESGLLHSIPLLLRDFIPNLDYLPMFLMRLGPQVRFCLNFWELGWCWCCHRLIGLQKQNALTHSSASSRIFIAWDRCFPQPLPFLRLPKTRRHRTKLSDGKSSMFCSLLCAITLDLPSRFLIVMSFRSQVCTTYIKSLSDVDSLQTYLLKVLFIIHTLHWHWHLVVHIWLYFGVSNEHIGA